MLSCNSTLRLRTPLTILVNELATLVKFAGLVVVFHLTANRPRLRGLLLGCAHRSLHVFPAYNYVFVVILELVKLNLLLQLS